MSVEKKENCVLETIGYCAPQLWTILSEKLKQRNTISFFKMMSDNGYVMNVHTDYAKYLYQTQGLFEVQLLTCHLIFIIDFLTRVHIHIYLYVLPSREIHVKLGIYWHLLLFDTYLPASTHFINLNFFILLGFFVVDINQFLNYCKH